ncbi:hypothetical protein AVEN_267798-1 [Araneus ventricosus]|uniref:Uncharacterized protein n=1 Tax=Araneus ventricosus TaxID=182803 RepID=A0A4Y2D3G3_ARAVE|nr:hypothetical protein AVEN_267798-1 [Araneus ventricosus]
MSAGAGMGWGARVGCGTALTPLCKFNQIYFVRIAFNNLTQCVFNDYDIQMKLKTYAEGKLPILFSLPKKKRKGKVTIQAGLCGCFQLRRIPYW